MTQALAAVPKPVPAAMKSVTARRVRFVVKPPPGATVIRKFRQPKASAAVQEIIELTDLPVSDADDEPVDSITLLLLPADPGAEAKRLSEKWMTPAGGPGAVATLSLSLNNCKIQWRPGKATVQGPLENVERAFDALVEFAFLEGELRRLERLLERQEAQAPADVPRAHRIRFRDRGEWQRIGETVELLYSMRLTYGRLESRFATVLHTMQRDARQLIWSG